ncbi:MAG: hypothetical protein ACRD0P_30800, partial [Stackebrandtia sp.]
EDQPAESGGVHAEHWRRHDVSIAVHLTPDDRVMTAVFIRHGPWESADWEELDIHSADLLRDLIDQAGLHGVARPARLPGLWRITIAELAVDATDAADADSDVRLVTRLADALDEDSWTFADDGTPVPLAPPLPEIPVASRNDVVKYVLGDHIDDKQARDLVSVVFSCRARNGINFGDALRLLADIDDELYRRAITAAAGRGKPFDVDRAREALERLAEGDPALPLNSIGQHIQLEPDPTGKPSTDNTSTPPGPRHGVVVEVTPQASNLLRVTINRDADTGHDDEPAQQDVLIDAVLTVYNPAEQAASIESSARAVAPPTANTEATPQRADQPLPVPPGDAVQTHQVGLFDVDILATANADPIPRQPAGTTATAEASTEHGDAADGPASMAGDGEAATAQGDRDMHRAPLTDHDIAIALGRALQGRMS